MVRSLTELLRACATDCIGRPPGSHAGLTERLVLFALLSLVTCCLVVVEGITSIAAMAFRCAAIVLVTLGVTACLTGVFPMNRWASSGTPRGDIGSALPAIEVGCAWDGRDPKLGTADNDDVRIPENDLKAGR